MPTTTNPTTAQLRCIEDHCRATFAITERLYTCPNCQGLLDVAYEFDKPLADEWKALFKARRTSDAEVDRSGVWRFRELLPFVNDTANIVTLNEGNTPIYTAPRSAEYAALDHLRFKHQGMNPTGSFKDNGMTTGLTQAKILGAKAVACASTGNTSASMAAYAARAGMRGVVFIPARQIAYGKLSQSLEYGSLVVEIEGNFDDAMKLVRDLAEETELYLLNSINPFRLEGQKAIAIEMLEQLHWLAPDWLVVPGGNLGNSSAIGKGLFEMRELGLIDRLPRLAVIQAEGASPLYEFMQSDDKTIFHPFAHPATLATAIKIGKPVSWKKALRALAWTNGVVERVSEQEIADAKAMIGRDGIGCEPASATTLAGIKKLVAAGVIKSDANIVAVLTGNVMKDPTYSIHYHTDQLTFNEADAEQIIKGNFANKGVRVAADKQAIRRLLEL
ncbi:MAG: threonine synthase [Acidobacteria bacterium]|nr:threonine synthase [Acidobacteriota bacterium]